MKSITIKHEILGRSVVTQVEEQTMRDDDSLLPFLRQQIDCRTIERVEVTLQGKQVTIWLDEEGLYQRNEAFESLAGPGKLIGFLVQDDDGRKYPIAGTLVLTGSDNDDSERVNDVPFNQATLRELFGSQITPVTINSFQ